MNLQQGVIGVECFCRAVVQSFDKNFTIEIMVQFRELSFDST